MQDGKLYREQARHLGHLSREMKNTTIQGIDPKVPRKASKPRGFVSCRAHLLSLICGGGEKTKVWVEDSPTLGLHFSNPVATEVMGQQINSFNLEKSQNHVVLRLSLNVSRMQTWMREKLFMAFHG